MNILFHSFTIRYSEVKLIWRTKRCQQLHPQKGWIRNEINPTGLNDTKYLAEKKVHGISSPRISDLNLPRLYLQINLGIDRTEKPENWMKFYQDKSSVMPPSPFPVIIKDKNSSVWILWSVIKMYNAVIKCRERLTFIWRRLSFLWRWLSFQPCAYVVKILIKSRIYFPRLRQRETISCSSILDLWQSKYFFMILFCLTSWQGPPSPLFIFPGQSHYLLFS